MNFNFQTKILKNKGQCGVCKDVIESKYTHDFVKCKCGNSFVDGGTDYLRRGGSIIDLSEYAPLNSEQLKVRNFFELRFQDLIDKTNLENEEQIGALLHIQIPKYENDLANHLGKLTSETTININYQHPYFRFTVQYPYKRKGEKEENVFYIHKNEFIRDQYYISNKVVEEIKETIRSKASPAKPKMVKVVNSTLPKLKKKIKKLKK